MKKPKIVTKKQKTKKDCSSKGAVLKFDEKELQMEESLFCIEFNFKSNLVLSF